MSVYKKVRLSQLGIDRYDESADPDYDPSGGEECKPTQEPRQKRRSSSREIKRAKKNKPETNNIVDDSKRCTDEEIEQSPWGSLPIEVLTKIFEYVVAVESSALPCLDNLKRVCRQWNFAAESPYLWTHMAFTPVLIKNETTFKKYSSSDDFKNYAKYHFRHTHTLSCAGLDRVTATLIKSVSDSSKELRSVSIMAGGSLTLTNCFHSLIEKHAKCLEKFSIKHTRFLPAAWRKLLNGFGERMRELEVCQGRGNTFAQRIEMPFSHLKNLTVLKLHGYGPFSLRCVAGLTNLKTLHIKGLTFDFYGVEYAASPDLEDVDFSCDRISTNPSALENHSLLEFLSNCQSLKKLCIRFRYISLRGLYKYLKDCNQIVHLDVTVDDSFGTNSITIGSLVKDIGPSLKELYIDGFKHLDESLLGGVNDLSAWGNLTTLSMQQTNITLSTLRMYLEKSWKSLTMLDISTCRELPRGCKRNWTDMDELKAVLKKSSVAET